MNTKLIFKLSLLILAMSVSSAVFSAEAPNFNKQQTSGIAVPDFGRSEISSPLQKKPKSPQVQQKIATQKAQVRQKKATVQAKKAQTQKPATTTTANTPSAFHKKIQKDLLEYIPVAEIQATKQREDSLKRLATSGNQIAMIKYAYTLSEQNDNDYEYELDRLGFDDDTLNELKKLLKSGATQQQSYAGHVLGYYHYQTEEYQQSATFIKKSAEQGNAVAQNWLGYMYRHGKGVTQDYTEAIKWFRKSAEQGNALAQNNLGVMYENGKGVTQNHAEAVKWYRKSAEQGDARGQYNLGMMYYHGKGVTQNHAEAFKWHDKSAEQGDADAQNNLGLMFLLDMTWE